MQALAATLTTNLWVMQHDVLHFKLSTDIAHFLDNLMKSFLKEMYNSTPAFVIVMAVAGYGY